MKLASFYLAILCLLGFSMFSQSVKPANVEATKPKLIVGLVVDQMRNDYIYRYWNRYGAGGFKRLINEGYYLSNAHYNYVPTFTGPGHSSIYTGTTPRIHGIIANEWFDKDQKKQIYCVDDETVRSVGTLSKNGKKSPSKQLSSTIGDELKLSSNGRSMVFAIALKDRSAILPAGHNADGAFWFDDSTANFVSSSWYMKELPTWLKEFNAKELSKKYLKTGWNTKYPIQTYTNSLTDNNAYEKASNKKAEPTFPYSYESQINGNNLGIIKATPHGNTITKDVAIACLKGESLGKDEYTDILAISFSSPDIIAHSYGPRSVEMEDVYLRLDKEIEEFIKVLDTEVGAGNYVLFLTADHGGADVPAHLMDEQIPAGYLTSDKVLTLVRRYFQKTYNDSSIVLDVNNEQIFLDEAFIARFEKAYLEQKLADYLITIKGIAEAYPSAVIKNSAYPERDIRQLIQNGYNHKLSGNVAYVLEPAWMDYMNKGTTHGAAYNYDTHVPLIFYGKGIEKGKNSTYTRITQIAPTISELMKINYPNGCTDDCIQTLLKN